MRYGGSAPGAPAVPREVPLVVRYLGKLVLEVLPPALASVIGGLVFAHFQFAHQAASRRAAAADAGGRASAQMVELIRQEHAEFRDYLIAQRAAAQSQLAAADAADARAAARAKRAEAAKRHNAAAAARRARPNKETAVAAAKPAPETPSPETQSPVALVVTRTAPGQDTMDRHALVPPADVSAASHGAAMAAASGGVPLVAATLAIPGRVLAATLHAVAAIGGVPSWIGHRFGDGDAEFRPRLWGAAS